MNVGNRSLMEATGLLLGEPPDYYRVEVEVELVPTGPGF